MDELHWFLEQVEVKGNCPALKQLMAGPPQATHRRATCSGCPFLMEVDSAREDLIEPQTLIDTSGKMPATQIGKDNVPPMSVTVNRRAQGDNNPKSFLEQMAERLDPTKPMQPDAMIPGMAPYMGQPIGEEPECQTVDRCGMLDEQVFSLRPLCRYTNWQAQARKELKELFEAGAGMYE